MAARFQRLANSEDIAAAPEVAYSQNFYDEPQHMYSNSPPPHHVHSPTSPHTYPMHDQRRMSYTARKPLPRSSLPLSQTTTPEQPLMDNYFTPTPQSVGSQSSYFDQKRKPRESVLAKTASSIWSRARGAHVSHVATPLWAAPWRHQPDPNGGNSSTVRVFDRVKQRNRIFFHFFITWLVPVFFCGALIVVLRHYSAKTKITRREKYMFNALVIGLSLCLGFATVDNMKGYGSIYRWRLLARRYRSLQEFELILGLASQKKALRLMWVGRTEGSIVPNGTQLLCFSYLMLMLGLQIVIALLGLCYSVDTAPSEYNLVKGNVSIANLQGFLQANTINDNVDPYQMQSAAINNYGIAGQSAGYTIGKSVKDGPDPTLGLSLYTDNQTAWWYYFIDQCPEADCTTAYITNRSIESTAQCVELKILAGGFVKNDSVSFLDQWGVRSTNPYFKTETSATTTWYASTVESCGDRCTGMYVLNVGWEAFNGDVWKPQLFQCNNTISQISNLDHLTGSEQYSLPNEQARLIAGAIGYNGANWKEFDYYVQARTYDIGSLWSWTRMNGNPWTETDVANLIMHFSVGAAAAVDLTAPRHFVVGDTPVPAQKVEVLWRWALIVLIAVPCIQFLVLITTVIWGNVAIIRDDSFLAAASLLRPIVEKLERSGCALTSDEICEVLGNPSVAYGVRMPGNNVSYGMMKGQDDVMHLDVIFEDEADKIAQMGWRTGFAMPPGRYDGLKEATDDKAVGFSTARSTGELRKRRGSF